MRGRKRFGLVVAGATFGALAVAVATVSCAPLPQASSASSTVSTFRQVPGQVFPQPQPAPARPFRVTGDFCADLQALQAQPTSAVNDPTAAFRSLEGLKSEAPPELQDVFDLITTAIVALGTTDATDQVAVQQALTTLSDPKFQSGMNRLASYARNTCGVVLSGLDDVGTPGPGAVPGG
jgi:hypothetical protein